MTIGESTTRILRIGPIDRDAAEQRDAVAQQHRHDVQLQLVDQAGREELPGHVGAAADGHVPVAGRLLRQFERPVHPVRDEHELDRPGRRGVRRAVGDDEMLDVVGRLVPAAGVLTRCRTRRGR